MTKYNAAPPEIRFWRFVDKNGPLILNTACWVWVGGTSEGGYGRFWAHGKMVYAHRWSFENANGPISVGMLACHRCDHPRCANPHHLFAGTTKENSLDMVSKGRLPRHAKKIKITKTLREKIAKERTAGTAPGELAQRYGISRRTVRHYCQR